MSAERAGSREALEAIVREHNALYERGAETIPDDEYDELASRLEAAGGPPPSLAGAAPGKHRLPYPMMSLDKATGAAALSAAVRRLGSERLVVSHKLDGVSALVHLPRAGAALRMYTRGDGSRGRDVSALLPAARRPSLGRAMRAAGVLAIRGELVAPKGSLGPGKTRSAVAGVVASSSPSPRDVEALRFVAYEAHHEGAKASPSEQMAVLEGLLGSEGVAPWESIPSAGAEAGALEASLRRAREESPYEVDGLVLCADSAGQATPEGRNPPWAFAFKPPVGPEARAEVSALEWRPSRRGRLSPVVVFSPVTLGGSVVTRASGKSAANVVSKGIAPGAAVLVRLGGDVIPEVSRVLSPAPSVPMPELPHEWEEGGVHLRLIPRGGRPPDEVRAASILHFLSSIGARGAGPSAASSLAAAGFSGPWDVYSAGEAGLSGVLGPGPGARLALEIERGVASSGLAVLASAFGDLPAGVGESRAAAALAALSELPASAWGGVDPCPEALAGMLLGAPGFGPVTSKSVAEGLFAFLGKAAERGLPLRPPGPACPPEGCGIKGPSVAFSGVRDRPLEELVAAKGGRVHASVSASTDYLVTPGGVFPGTAKGRRAEELGVRAVTPEGLREALGGLRDGQGEAGRR